jgi:hypothetical protein
VWQQRGILYGPWQRLLADGHRVIFLRGATFDANGSNSIEAGPTVARRLTPVAIICVNAQAVLVPEKCACSKIAVYLRPICIV